MNSQAPTIEAIEQCLDEGRLGDIKMMPPFLGPLPTPPKLRPTGTLVAHFPNEVLRHAKAWARVKRALRDAERPNPHRGHREIKPDPEFVACNATHLMFRHVGVKCGFQWPVARDFHHHFVVLPSRAGQASQLAREHIHRPEHNIWSLMIGTVRDAWDKLTVPDHQIFGDPHGGGLLPTPWKAHAAVVSGTMIPAHPYNCFVVSEWAGIEELVHGNPTERTYDYVDSQGRAKIGTLACRQVSRAKLRPITELLQMLDGWDLDRLKAEGRIEVRSGIRSGSI